jgi:tetratricopeptide (TPR) repeat protein
LHQGIQQVFGPENPNLPPSAKKEYRFKSLPASSSPEKRQAWEAALSSAATGRLSNAAPAFAQLTQQDSQDAAAWYNLALSHAWMGDNAGAVEALDRYVGLETDDAQAIEAWTLAEVLRVGQGMEDLADYVEHSITVPLRDPQGFVKTLGELEKQHLVTAAQVNEEEGVLTAIILDPPPPALTQELQARQNARLGAFLLFMGNILRLWSTDKEALERTFAGLEKRAGGTLGQPIAVRGPAKFHDIATGAVSFPQNALSQDDIQNRVREGIERYYEEQWLHRPLKALGGVPPVDAVGHALLRKKLRGVLQFQEEVMTAAHLKYDFDRLRRKLGLLDPVALPAAASASAAFDFGVMSVPELAALALESLEYGQVEAAYQAALKLDARELAGKFASALVSRPPQAEKPDRFPLFNHLINVALAQGDTTAALDHVNAGAKDDCEHNDGRRRNDYELRRGQLHAKRGEIDQATDVFDRLIERAPSELKYPTTAAEALLSAKQGAKALRYAEAGLIEARKQQNRDAEGHLSELADAARRAS